MMVELQLLDKAYAVVMNSLMDRGYAASHVEVALALGLPVEEARQLYRELVNGGYHSAWLEDGTDYVVSFAPFNNLPTQYRVSVDGEQKWFAQCGFEALAIRWLFPGKLVRVDAPCLDCGQPMALEFRDEDLLLEDPPGMVGYTGAQLGDRRVEGHSWR
jgi:Alkylmercury lyase